MLNYKENDIKFKLGNMATAEICAKLGKDYACTIKRSKVKTNKAICKILKTRERRITRDARTFGSKFNQTKTAGGKGALKKI